MRNSERVEKTKSGVKWSLLGQIINQIFNIIIAVLLTRLLSPDDFGLIGMVLVFSGVLDVIKDFGIGIALIYKKNISNKDYDTAFWAQVIFGAFLTVLFMSCSDIIAEFFNQPLIGDIVKIVSLIFVIDSLGFVHLAFLRKQMIFKKIFYVDIFSVIMSGCISVIIAITYTSVWSLVVKIMLLSLVRTIILWLIVEWRPHFRFCKRTLIEQLKYGGPIIGNQLVTYISRNGDNLLIGRYIGAEALGVYNRAYSLMILPVNHFVNLYSKVLFPSFCLINNNNEIFVLNWIKITRLTTFLMLPVTSLIFLLADDFVVVVLGSQWLGVIPVLKYLSFAAAVETICNVGYIYNAKGKNKELLIMSSGINILLIISVIVGLPYGIERIAFNYAVASVVFIPIPVWFITSKIINCSIFKIFKSIYIIILINELLLVIFSISKTYILISSIYYIISIPIIYISIYILCMIMVKEKVLIEFINIVKRNQ